MIAAQDLAAIGTGFSDAIFDSQRVFRAALDVLSRPGTVGEIALSIDLPRGLHVAAGATLLALLDQDTRLWLSPSVPPDVARYLRFHTSCEQAVELAQADFALIAHPGELPPLAAFAQGTADFPDRSTTIVLQVSSFMEGERYVLSGPGIAGRSVITVPGLDADFGAGWNARRRSLPCGVDLFLAAGNQLVGLPRTTRIET